MDNIAIFGVKYCMVYFSFRRKEYNLLFYLCLKKTKHQVKLPLYAFLYCLCRSNAESNKTNVFKNNIKTFTKILDSLLDGYDNRLRPGLGGEPHTPAVQ